MCRAGMTVLRVTSAPGCSGTSYGRTVDDLIRVSLRIYVEQRIKVIKSRKMVMRQEDLIKSEKLAESVHADVSGEEFWKL